VPNAIFWPVKLSHSTAASYLTTVAPIQGFSDAGIDKASHALVRSASEKRQGTKSREVGRRWCGELYGDLSTGNGIGIAGRRDGTGWRGMPSEPVGADGWRERGARCPIGPLPGSWKATLGREPPLRAGNRRQGRTERLGIGETNGIMRCRS
jgi:hypothetical protein